MAKAPILAPDKIKAALIARLENDPHGIGTAQQAGGVCFSADTVATYFDGAVIDLLHEAVLALDTRPHSVCVNCGEHFGNLSRPVSQQMVNCTLCAGGVTRGKVAYGQH